MHEIGRMSNSETIATCMDLCKSKKMPLIGFAEGNICYCIRGGINTNDVRYMCDVGCWYDHSQNCGGIEVVTVNERPKHVHWISVYEAGW